MKYLTQVTGRGRAAVTKPKFLEEVNLASKNEKLLDRYAREFFLYITIYMFLYI